MKPLIARRPVFDTTEKIFAYDLSLRGPAGASGLYKEAHPEQLIAEIFLEIGLDRVAEGHRVFVTVDRDLLLRGSLPELPAERVILHIPTSVGADAETTAAAGELVSAGHRLAIQLESPPQASALLELAHVIRVDVASLGAEHLTEVAKGLAVFPARLLATNVRHSGERDVCANLGFELFEGYRFSAPETFTRRDLGIEHLNVFRVLKLVRDPKASDQEIEQLLQRDVGLSYKLLRMVNSASTGARGISSIGHALRILGREQVGRWLAILLATDGAGHGVRAELVHLALVRARMGELLADLLGAPQSRGPLFLVGMVSVLDQLLELPMQALCDAMQLAPELCGALLQHSGFLGSALRLIEAYVAGDWPTVDAVAPTLSIDSALLLPLYLDALSWATSNRRIE